MPVLVNYKRCNCMPLCFAAKACPKETLRMDLAQMKVVVDPTVCGDCPAPCLNFCDSMALKFAPTLEELDIMQRELDGVLTVEAAAAERQALAEKRKAAEEAEKESGELAEVAPVALSSQNFMEEVVQSELPVLVDFWAEWCGPCKQIAPVVEELAREFAGVIKFGKLNVDEEPQIAGQLGIQSIPTLMIFYGGQVVDMIVGAVGKEQLKGRLQRVVEALSRAQAAQGRPASGPSAKAARKAPAPPPNGGPAQPSQPAAPRPNILRAGFGAPPPPRRPRQ